LSSSQANAVTILISYYMRVTKGNLTLYKKMLEVVVAMMMNELLILFFSSTLQ